MPAQVTFSSLHRHSDGLTPLAFANLLVSSGLLIVSLRSSLDFDDKESPSELQSITYQGFQPNALEQLKSAMLIFTH
ncbi:hypothetical protein TNCV_455151 [Trichonephila clavipes]|nr:hypothetical protein TNCV_455151 [Trichonephila clavipes]